MTYQELTFTTIEENLEMAKHCIDTPKPDSSDSCYGMSALILLASTIDAIGTFYRNMDRKFAPIDDKAIAKKTLRSTMVHFEAYHDKFLTDNCNLQEFTKYLYKHARCLAIHNGTLSEHVEITKNRNANGAVIVKQNMEHVISLPNLYDNVLSACMQAKKESKQDTSAEQYGPLTSVTADNQSVSAPKTGASPYHQSILSPSKPNNKTWKSK